MLTYDYRAIGGSDAPPAATVEQWGAVDQASMIEHLARLRPGASLGLVGHSFGGQVLGLADNIADIDAAVLICSQSGHWRHWPLGRRRLRMLALWWLLIPGLTAATGRFPGAWIGTANLPASIARSWARWGRSRHYVCDGRGRPLRPHNDDVRFPIRWMSFCDDPVAPFGAVEALRSYYPDGAGRAPPSGARRSRCRRDRSFRLLPQVDAARGVGRHCCLVRGAFAGGAQLQSRVFFRGVDARATGVARPQQADWAPTEGLNAFLEKRPAAFKGR